MGVAELVVLLVIGGICYVALTPLRRALERWMLRRRERRAERIIPLIRNSHGVYTTSTRRTNGD